MKLKMHTPDGSVIVESNMVTQFYADFESGGELTTIETASDTGEVIIVKVKHSIRQVTSALATAWSVDEKKAEGGRPMSNIDKQALNQEKIEWLNKLADMEYCKSNPGHWLMSLKDTNMLAKLALRSVALLDELEAKDKSISFLKDQLAQLANFNPDWDKLEAATDSLREHMAELTAARKRIAELERKEQHSDRQSVIDALASSGEEWSDIEEYMQKWDAERAAAAGKGE